SSCSCTGCRASGRPSRHPCRSYHSAKMRARMNPEDYSSSEWPGADSTVPEPNGDAGAAPDGHAGSNGKPPDFHPAELEIHPPATAGLAVPFARPVLADAHDLAMALEYARRVSPRALSWWRALLEALM